MVTIQLKTTKTHPRAGCAKCAQLFCFAKSCIHHTSPDFLAESEKGPFFTKPCASMKTILDHATLKEGIVNINNYMILLTITQTKVNMPSSSHPMLLLKSAIKSPSDEVIRCRVAHARR